MGFLRVKVLRRRTLQIFKARTLQPPGTVESNGHFKTRRPAGDNDILSATETMLRYYMKNCHLLTLAIPQSYVTDVQLHTTRQRNGLNK